MYQWYSCILCRLLSERYVHPTMNIQKSCTMYVYMREQKIRRLNQFKTPYILSTPPCHMWQHNRKTLGPKHAKWRDHLKAEICFGLIPSPQFWHQLRYRHNVYIYIQWNLGIRDTHGTVKNCPEFWGGLISQVHFCVLNRPMGWSSCP